MIALFLASAAANATASSGLEVGYMHGTGQACGCAMHTEPHDFYFDCDMPQAQLETAMHILENNCEYSKEGCAVLNANNHQECQSSFYVLQAYHDYCEHGAISAQHDATIHKWESVCHTCQVSRKYDPSLAHFCPAVRCDDVSIATLAYLQLNTTCTAEAFGCCDDEEEKGAYEILMAYHDQCHEDAIPLEYERALLTYAASCDSARCNQVGDHYDPHACPVSTPPSPPPIPTTAAGGQAAINNQQVPHTAYERIVHLPLWIDGLYVFFGVVTFILLITCAVATCAFCEVRSVKNVLMFKRNTPKLVELQSMNPNGHTSSTSHANGHAAPDDEL